MSCIPVPLSSDVVKDDSDASTYVFLWLPDVSIRTWFTVFNGGATARSGEYKNYIVCPLFDSTTFS